jgi:hypothetical protein
MWGFWKCASGATHNRGCVHVPFEHLICTWSLAGFIRCSCRRCMFVCWSRPSGSLLQMHIRSMQIHQAMDPYPCVLPLYVRMTKEHVQLVNALFMNSKWSISCDAHKSKQLRYLMSSLYTLPSELQELFVMWTIMNLIHRGRRFSSTDIELAVDPRWREIDKRIKPSLF